MTVFLDTMVYLHYRSVEAIDLRSELRADRIIIVIPRITVRELDAHKSSHPSSKIRDRARRTLQKIERWAQAPTQIREGVEARYYADIPSIGYAEHNLNPSWNDDVLVATILQYRTDFPTETVLLISQDTGPRLTAGLHGIGVYQLPEEHKLPTESDPVETENRELHKVIERLQSALPQLSVFFKGSDPPQSHIAFKLPRPQQVRDKVSVQLTKIKSQYPKLSPTPTKPVDTSSVSAEVLRALIESSDFYRIPPEEYDRYNSEIEHFYVQYERYLNQSNEFEDKNRRTIAFEIQISNTGTAPADDVDVLFSFPDGFELSTEEDLALPPREPELPSPPHSKMQRLVSDINRSAGIYIPPPPLTPDFGPFTNFSIRRTSSYEVDDHFDRIKHGSIVALPKLFLTFDLYDSVRSFNCRYILRPANVPDPIEGDLHFVISRAEIE